MAGRNNIWADLVVAVLSVNSFPLERAFQYFDGLEAEGLFRPDKLASWDESEVARRLARAGYNRGPAMTEIFSRRLVALGRYVSEHGVENCGRTLTNEAASDVANFLRPIYGVGEVVIRNFLVLRGLEQDSQP